MGVKRNGPELILSLVGAGEGASWPVRGRQVILKTLPTYHLSFSNFSVLIKCGEVIISDKKKTILRQK